MRRKNSEITNRKIVQDRIREVYPERLGQYELSCCACCLYRKEGACRWELLPVTSQEGDVSLLHEKDASRINRSGAPRQFALERGSHETPKDEVPLIPSC